ncbi:hypothetical protein P4O66_012916, partial [Electrophorus voltai]
LRTIQATLYQYVSQGERRIVQQGATKSGINVTTCKIPLRQYATVKQRSCLKKQWKSFHLTVQVIAGFRYQLKFDMQKSNCTKSDFKEVTEECHPDQEAPSFINCNSTVDVAPWRLELPETHVQCAPGPIQSFMFKRPPGWSPLRSVHNLAVHQEPSNKPLKTESSDESNESKAMPTATRPSC